jgi:hypothetical protein
LEYRNKLSSDAARKVAHALFAGQPMQAIHIMGQEDPITAGKTIRFNARYTFDNGSNWIDIIDEVINIPDGGGGGGGGITPVTPVMPPDGSFVVKAGGWGGNQDPTTWTITAMHDDPSLSKVVDGAGKNIATNFAMAAIAQQYIDYFRFIKGIPVVTPVVTPTDVTPVVTPVVSGSKRLYTPKTGGRIKTVVNTSGSQGASSGIRYNILSDATLVNRETTFIGQVKEVVDHSHDHWSLKCGSHGQAGEGCALLEVQQPWGGGKGKLQTESPHPSYHPCSSGTTFDMPAFPFNKTVAIKFCSWQDGSGGMWCQYWYDFGDGVPAGNFSWKKYAELHYVGSACSPVTANDLGASGSIKGPSKTQDTARWNGANTTAWVGEIVEIDPPAAPL